MYLISSLCVLLSFAFHVFISKTCFKSYRPGWLYKIHLQTILNLGVTSQNESR